MKEGICSYCEDPLPEGAKTSFCDEMCKDLQSRSIRTRKRKVKDNLFAPLPSSPVDVVEQKKRFDTSVEPD